MSHFDRGDADHRAASPASFAQANARHFDCEAHSYEHHAGTRELIRRIAHAMQREYSFDEESTTVLDYACGTGMQTRNSLVFNDVHASDQACCRERCLHMLDQLSAWTSAQPV